MYEIEHKFIVDKKHIDLFINSNFNTSSIKQGYVIDDSQKGILRVRIKDDKKAYLTYKRSTTEYDKHIEIETEIPLDEANLLFDECQRKITKKRYIVPFEGNDWEVDIFDDKLDGLIIAEIEIPSVDKQYNKPEWVGKNVTDDSKFSNRNLATLSYKDLWCDNNSDRVSIYT